MKFNKWQYLGMTSWLFFAGWYYMVLTNLSKFDNVTMFYAMFAYQIMGIATWLIFQGDKPNDKNK